MACHYGPALVVPGRVMVVWRVVGVGGEGSLQFHTGRPILCVP
jgi:hypothetical protein